MSGACYSESGSSPPSEDENAKLSMTPGRPRQLGRVRECAEHSTVSPVKLDDSSTEELIAIIAEAEATKARAYARLMVPRDSPKVPDRTLNAREVANRIGMGKDWVYEHADEIPGMWRNGKILRFSAAAVEAWKRGVR